MATTNGEPSSLDNVRLDHFILWDSPPEALEERILAKLPFSSLVTFRTVCKRWRYLIDSSKVIPRLNSGYPHVVYFSRGKLFLLKRGTWETVSLQFLPCVLQNMVMATGGLVCFCTSEDWEFVVCNPLTKCYKRLQVPCSNVSTIAGQPCMPTPAPGDFPLGASLVVGLVVDCDTGHFKLIVGGFFPGSQGTTLVYDSHVESWKKAANIPDDVLEVGRSHIRNHHPVNEKLSCGGNLYFHFEDPHRQELFKLLEYSVEKQAWGWIKMPCCDSCNFMQRNGKILVVILVPMVIYFDGTVKACLVFELQDGSPRQSGDWQKCWFVNVDNLADSTMWPFSEEAVPSKTRIDVLAEGGSMYLIRRSADLSLGPQKTSVRGRFHEVATNSVVITDWYGYIEDDHEGFPNVHSQYYFVEVGRLKGIILLETSSLLLEICFS